MPTIDEALQHLGIDYADEMVTANVQRALASARRRVLGAVGDDVETYLPDDERVVQLVLLYTQENYDARDASAKEINARRRLTDDLELQLRLELRRAKAAAGGSV
jgi:uncharacterized protein (DUF1499 family)